MSDTMDFAAVLPILDEIESDLDVLKSEADRLSTMTESLTTRVDRFDIRITYLMGLTLQHRIDLMHMRSDVAAINKWLDRDGDAAPHA